MGLKEKIIEHIRKITGDENAGLWTLQFNKDDINARLKDFSSPYFRGLKVRTYWETLKDTKKIFKKSYFKKRANYITTGPQL